MNPWMSCRFEYANFGEREKGAVIGLHKHSAYELVYYVKGAGHITIDGVRYAFAPGTFSLTEPGHFHEEDFTKSGHVIYIIFETSGNPAILKDAVWSDNKNETILHIMEDLKQEFYSTNEYRSVKLELCLKLLLIELSRLCSTNLPSADLHKSIQYMNEFCSQKIDLEALASQAGYSYSHFCKLVKEHTGKSPINYVIACRLEKAKYLLKYTTLPIAHISQECGFSTESQFCSIFRRETGMTPKGYRVEKEFVL